MEIKHEQSVSFNNNSQLGNHGVGSGDHSSMIIF